MQKNKVIWESQMQLWWNDKTSVQPLWRYQCLRWMISTYSPGKHTMYIRFRDKCFWEHKTLRKADLKSRIKRILDWGTLTHSHFNDRAVEITNQERIWSASDHCNHWGSKVLIKSGNEPWNLHCIDTLLHIFHVVTHCDTSPLFSAFMCVTQITRGWWRWQRASRP